GPAARTVRGGAGRRCRARDGDPAAAAAAAPRTVRRGQSDPGEVGAGAPGPLRRRTAPAAHRTRRGPPAGGRSGAARGGIAGVVRRGSALLPPPLAGRGTRAVRGRRLPPPLAGEGWGGGSSVASTRPRLRRAPPPLSPPRRGQKGRRTRRTHPTPPIRREQTQLQ